MRGSLASAGVLYNYFPRTWQVFRMSSSFRACALCFGLWFSLVWCPGADAARTFPQNSVQVKITEVNDAWLVADGKTLHIAPGVVIFTASNSTLVRGAMPVNVIARIQLDFQGDVRRVWLLADDEILEKPWWKFWQREQPQSQPVPQSSAYRIYAL